MPTQSWGIKMSRQFIVSAQTKDGRVGPTNITLAYSGAQAAAVLFMDQHEMLDDYTAIPSPGRLLGVESRDGKLLKTCRFEAINEDQTYGAVIYVSEVIGTAS